MIIIIIITIITLFTVDFHITITSIAYKFWKLKEILNKLCKIVLTDNM